VVFGQITKIRGEGTRFKRKKNGAQRRFERRDIHHQWEPNAQVNCGKEIGHCRENQIPEQGLQKTSVDKGKVRSSKFLCHARRKLGKNKGSSVKDLSRARRGAQARRGTVVRREMGQQSLDPRKNTGGRRMNKRGIRTVVT